MVPTHGIVAHRARRRDRRPVAPQHAFDTGRLASWLDATLGAQGGPVEGATVSPSSLADGRLDWGAVTDAQGRFEWTEAPTSGTIRLDVFHTAFEQALGRSVEPDRRDIAITLHRPLHLHGKVTDAVSGQPVERFSLIPGWGPHVPGADVQWLRGSAQPQGNGRFDLTGGLFPDQGIKRSIRIEAPGKTLDRLAGAIEREG